MVPPTGLDIHVSAFAGKTLHWSVFCFRLTQLSYGRVVE
jgi:hypothetical protein